MNIKEKSINNIFSGTITRQFDKKNLFITTIEISDDKFCQILISYETIVGVLVNRVWLLLSNRYSATTSRQLSYIRRELPLAESSETVNKSELIRYIPEKLRGYFISYS
jgi:hypothetical protein